MNEPDSPPNSSLDHLDMSLCSEGAGGRMVSIGALSVLSGISFSGMVDLLDIYVVIVSVLLSFGT